MFTQPIQVAQAAAAGGPMQDLLDDFKDLYTMEWPFMLTILGIPTGFFLWLLSFILARPPRLPVRAAMRTPHAPPAGHDREEEPGPLLLEAPHVELRLRHARPHRLPNRAAPSILDRDDQKCATVDTHAHWDQLHRHARENTPLVALEEKIRRHEAQRVMPRAGQLAAVRTARSGTKQPRCTESMARPRPLPQHAVKHAYSIRCRL